ncbi:hypothetical protein [Streptomyces sp. NBC_00057]|uniref:hypothetical protein n=1 Tax=Streptomyces sp. NBC_00057 TaxID=2975634 RepID=UPI003244933C
MAIPQLDALVNSSSLPANPVAARGPDFVQQDGEVGLRGVRVEDASTKGCLAGESGSGVEGAPSMLHGGRDCGWFSASLVPASSAVDRR